MRYHDADAFSRGLVARGAAILPVLHDPERRLAGVLASTATRRRTALRLGVMVRALGAAGARARPRPCPGGRPPRAACLPARPARETAGGLPADGRGPADHGCRVGAARTPATTCATCRGPRRSCCAPSARSTRQGPAPDRAARLVQADAALHARPRTSRPRDRRPADVGRDLDLARHRATDAGRAVSAWQSRPRSRSPPGRASSSPAAWPTSSRTDRCSSSSRSRARRTSRASRCGCAAASRQASGASRCSRLRDGAEDLGGRQQLELARPHLLAARRGSATRSAARDRRSRRAQRGSRARAGRAGRCRSARA